MQGSEIALHYRQHEMVFRYYNTPNRTAADKQFLSGSTLLCRAMLGLIFISFLHIHYADGHFLYCSWTTQICSLI